MKKSLLLFLLLLPVALPLTAQSNDIIDRLLEEEEADFAKAAYLALVASGLLPEEATLEEALGVLAEQGWRLEVKQAGEPIKLGEYAYMLMEGFHLRGGLMYSIIPGARYAAREIAYLEFVEGSGDPNRRISGEEAIRILGRLLEWKEERS